MSIDQEFALEWLKKAENDLKTARLVMAAEDGPLDTACFHAQQVVEKSLKGLLTLQSRTFPRVHVLQLLLDILVDIYPELERFREQFVMLSIHAVESRYPGDYIEPERHEAEAAMVVAEAVITFAREKVATI